MNIGHASSHRIFNRDHGQGAGPAAHRLKGLVKGRAGHGLMAWKMQRASFVAIGAEFTLKGDFWKGRHGRLIRLELGRKGAGGLKVRRGIHRDGETVHHRGPDRQAHFKGPKLFKPF